jgi:hypothetical protein
MRSLVPRIVSASLAALLLTLAALPAFAESPAAPPSPAATSEATLTDAQEQGLLYMREEEKLAHDLYVLFGEQWGVRSFARIVQAESNHEAQVLGAMARYGLSDPAAELSLGEFSNADLQALYDQLAAEGAVSLREALRVAALVEETDIADLDAELADDGPTPLPADVAAVYEHLRFGSTNHLRAYVRQLNRLGESYAPVVLDQESFDAILSARGR